VNVSTILSPIVVNDARAKQFFTTYQSSLLLYLFSPGPLPFESSKRMPGYKRDGLLLGILEFSSKGRVKLRKFITVAF